MDELGLGWSKIMAGARIEPISKFLTDRWQTFEQNLQNDDTQNFCQQFPSRNYIRIIRKPQSVKTASFGPKTSIFHQEKLVIVQNNLYNLW